jgi:hypothetical protein
MRVAGSRVITGPSSALSALLRASVILLPRRLSIFSQPLSISCRRHRPKPNHAFVCNG